MTQGSELERLEMTVNSLLQKYSMLKQEKTALEAEVAQKNEQIVSLQGKIDNMQSERGDVSERVNRLLDQIEKWEDGDDVPQTAVDQAEVLDVEPAEANLDEDSVESRQGSLFTADGGMTTT